MNSGHTNARLFKTSILAGLTGAGIALLLAPQSGKRTRQDLKGVAGKLQRSTNKRGTNFDPLSVSTGREEPALRADDLQDHMRYHRENFRQPSVLTNWEEEV